MCALLFKDPLPFRFWSNSVFLCQAVMTVHGETETLKDRFPELPQEHPVMCVDKTAEHGKDWFSQSVDSDACLVMENKRWLFIHKAFVAEKSGFFQEFFGNDLKATPADYMLSLPNNLRFDYVKTIVLWMYTGSNQNITWENGISMMREAKYLLMPDEFMDILRQSFITAYKAQEDSAEKDKMAMSLPEQASDISMEELLKLLDDCGISADLCLKILATWAEKQSLSEKATQTHLVFDRLSQIFKTCTFAGMQKLHAEYPKFFDHLPASALLELTRSPEWTKNDGRFSARCSRCKKTFWTQEEMNSTSCGPHLAGMYNKHQTPLDALFVWRRNLSITTATDLPDINEGMVGWCFWFSQKPMQIWTFFHIEACQQS